MSERRGGVLYWCCAVDTSTDARFLVLSDAAFRLWAMGNCYSRGQGTDGWVPRVALVSLTRAARPQRLVDELLAGVPGFPRPPLWAAEGEGWRIAEWALLNVSAAEIDAKRESQRVRMQILRALAPYPDGLTEDQLGQVDPSVRTYLELRPDGRWHRRRLSDRELTVSARPQSQDANRERTVSKRDRDRGRGRGKGDGEEGQSPPPPTSHPESLPPTAPPAAVDPEDSAPELPGMPAPVPVETPPRQLTAVQEAQRRVAEALAAAEVPHPGPSVVQLWLEEARKDADLVVRVIRDCHGAGRLLGVALPTAYLFAAVRSAAQEAAAAAAKDNGHAAGAGGAERAQALRQAETALSRVLHLEHPQLRQEAEREWTALAKYLGLSAEASAEAMAAIRRELYGEAA